MLVNIIVGFENNDEVYDFDLYLYEDFEALPLEFYEEPYLNNRIDNFLDSKVDVIFYYPDWFDFLFDNEACQTDEFLLLFNLFWFEVEMFFNECTTSVE